MIDLLSRLIATPSISRDESATATLLFDWLDAAGAEPERVFNNVFAVAPDYDPSRPTLLLNSHHDTVKPAPSYTRDPFSPAVEDGRLYGLGSNDAGASAVALAHAFLVLRERPLPVNLVLAITAEEEVGGEKGMRAFLPALAERGVRIDAAIVGEPTGMNPAVAERGLVVLDAVTRGVTGHVARNEGRNAIYSAMADIDAIRQFRPERCSDVLGPISANVTQIDAGWQHNAVPDECRWVVDVRTTDAYSNAATVELLRGTVSAYTTLTPRSTRVQASVIAESHPLAKAAVALGGRPFVSPTTSDMSLMHGIPSLKIGPGQSSRSHSADEFVKVSELEAALPFYIKLVELYSQEYASAGKH